MRLTPHVYAVLCIFLEEPASLRHGYELVKRTGLPSGTLYPILLRLERERLIASRWDESEKRGPRRRLYRLADDVGKNLVGDYPPS